MVCGSMRLSGFSWSRWSSTHSTRLAARSAVSAGTSPVARTFHDKRWTMCTTSGSGPSGRVHAFVYTRIRPSGSLASSTRQSSASGTSSRQPLIRMSPASVRSCQSGSDRSPRTSVSARSRAGVLSRLKPSDVVPSSRCSGARSSSADASTSIARNKASSAGPAGAGKAVLRGRWQPDRQPRLLPGALRIAGGRGM